MKHVKNIKLLASLLSLVGAAVWLAGCSGSDGGGGGGGAGNGTNAPTSIAGKAISHNITSGTAPLPSSGSFVLHAQGAAGDTTGPYTITGTGSITNSSGTYSYSQTDANTGTLHLDDSALGTVDETLTFTTPRSGTYQSSSGSGGQQSGTFITN